VECQKDTDVLLTIDFAEEGWDGRVGFPHNLVSEMDIDFKNTYAVISDSDSCFISVDFHAAVYYSSFCMVDCVVHHFRESVSPYFKYVFRQIGNILLYIRVKNNVFA
jgi:NAD(P)H-flavin reductase